LLSDGVNIQESSLSNKKDRKIRASESKRSHRVKKFTGFLLAGYLAMFDIWEKAQPIAYMIWKLSFASIVQILSWSVLHYAWM